MLEIFAFAVLTFFFALGAVTAFVFCYLRFCSPSERDRIFEISFSATGSYILELKWLICVFTLFGVNDRIRFRLTCEKMTDEQKREFSSVFSGYRNVFIDENIPES